MTKVIPLDMRKRDMRLEMVGQIGNPGHGCVGGGALNTRVRSLEFILQGAHDHSF